jgi:hypothetical protein
VIIAVSTTSKPIVFERYTGVPVVPTTRTPTVGNPATTIELPFPSTSPPSPRPLAVPAVPPTATVATTTTVSAPKTTPFTTFSGSGDDSIDLAESQEIDELTAPTTTTATTPSPLTVSTRARSTTPSNIVRIVKVNTIDIGKEYRGKYRESDGERRRTDFPASPPVDLDAGGQRLTISSERREREDENVQDDNKLGYKKTFRTTRYI